MPGALWLEWIGLTVVLLGFAWAVDRVLAWAVDRVLGWIERRMR